ncbi:MAG: NAD(+) diphosphatase [Planctomycetaceae bacterium]|nr:NAD(+) diphosphatase [Planctomycetaceae bacterium]
MIHLIHPHKYDNHFQRRDARPGDHVFIPKGDEALMSLGDGGDYLPTFAQLQSRLGGDAYGDAIYLFSVDDCGFFLLQQDVPEGDGFAYRPVMSFRSVQPRWRAFAGITASHLAGWFAHNRYCGACGELSQPKEDERAMRCPACGLVVYPSISPAVIVAVTNGDKLLLTRYANRPPSRNYALIAGFMEIGESLEDTVRREVMEEAGVAVKNLRYYGSQPWAFSSSMLAGFYCDVDGSDAITRDEVELAEAIWVPREEIPDQDVGVALTAAMIDAFRRGEYPR